MALLVRVDKSGQTIKRAGYPTSPVRIGRNPLNELCLEDPVVSQWHALVRFDERARQIILMDLGSTNGTSYNGSILAPHVPVYVTQNDVIAIGPITFNIVMANVPPELIEAGRQGSFNVSMGGGKATMMISPEKAQTMLFDPALASPGGGQSAATMIYQPGAQGLPAEETRVESFKEAFAEIENAVNRTRPAYEAYRESWGEVIRQLRARLREVPEPLREHVAFTLKTELPQVAREPEFFELLEELGISEVGGDVDVAEWLHRLKYGANSTVAREPINTKLAMERVGALLETFAESFISLRRGYDQFGQDMALQLTQEETPLTCASDYRGVLAVLLDWNRDGSRVSEDLKRAFADLAIHQVALLHGFVEGVRDLVRQVGPEALSTGQSTVLGQAGSGGFSFSKNSRMWKLYRRVHQSLIEEDRFARVVFGHPFARAYFDVTGGQAKD
jgi:type VI secretion system protein